MLLSALMVVIAVVGSHGGTSSTGQPLPPSLAVDRIAYVDLEGQIHTVRPDGSDEVRVSPDEGVSTWPTWSPDGRRMAFSRVVENGDGQLQANLYSLNTFTGRVREIHAGEPGVRSLVAQDAPHYLFWSPDGNRLAFIDSTSEGLQLWLENMTDDAGPVHILRGAPMYMDWSPDSRRLLIHRGQQHFIVDAETGTPRELPQPVVGFAYRAPAWGPTADQITLISGDISAGFFLYTSDGDEGRRTPVERVPDGAAFTWSPDGRLLALTTPTQVLGNSPLRLFVYPRVSLFREDGSRHELEIEDSVVAFFWSPDSTKLAYVTIASGGGILRWNVLDVIEGERWPLVEFTPSVQQLPVFRYFDQYAHSHSVWSPDSTALVFAGRVAAAGVGVSARQRAVNQIVLVPTQRNPFPRAIAQGILGFWSPR